MLTLAEAEAGCGAEVAAVGKPGKLAHRLGLRTSIMPRLNASLIQEHAQARQVKEERRRHVGGEILAVVWPVDAWILPFGPST
jgi:hypothetical protein